ncbi:MAG: hypothetical protein ACQER9_04675 [Nanobdellota archaeon]
MKQSIQMINIIFFFFFFSSVSLYAMEPLSDGQLKDVTGQAGASFAMEDAAFYYYSESLKFISVDNKDAFGNNCQGDFSLKDHHTLVTLDTIGSIDMGTYNAPDESYFAADLRAGSDDGRQYQGWRLRAIGGSQDDPYYWPVDEDEVSPVDESIAVLQSKIHHSGDFYSYGALEFCGESIGNFAINGITMPDYTLDGVSLPGSVLTVYPGPEGSSINFELRIRATIENVKLYRDGHPDDSDLNVKGIHFAEAFNSELPNHLEGTGNGGLIDTSGWGEGDDIKNRMYSGYFLAGNLNQVDFNDDISDSQLYAATLHDYNTYEWIGPVWKDEPLGLVANPTSFNIGSVGQDGDMAGISVTTGVHGSIRIESMEGHDGTGLGPMAVDGIRVKYCKIEFPASYTRDDGYGNEVLKGKIHPDQLDWLNNL